MNPGESAANDGKPGGPQASGDRSVAAGRIGGPVVTGDHNTVTITHQGTQVSIPDTNAVQCHRAELRRRLEQEALSRWGGMGAYIAEEGARLPIEVSPYQTGLTGLRNDLLRQMRQTERLLVLGEPGSGKTVALQRLAWELCGDPEPVIPVVVPLLFYSDKALKEWVRETLQETGHMRLEDDRALAAFLHEPATRCCFLFDGLNEVPQVRQDRLVEELVLWLKAYPSHPVIVTSRVQDELWRKLRQAMGEAVVIQPISDPQIQLYLQTQLGDERGRELFERMDERLRTLAQRPLLLWLMKEAGAAGESLPGNRGELYTRFVSRMLSRDTEERGLEASTPDRAKRQAAAQLAHGLQQRHALVCSRDEAVDIVAASMPGPVDAAVLALARHGFLVGDRQMRFAHQTLQEHFAAVALLEQAKREQACTGPRRLANAVSRALRGPDGLAALAGDEWWAECFIQLAGLVDDPAWLARCIAKANPWLAWWCVEEGRAVDAGTRDLIESRSIKLLKSDSPVQRRLAVQALARMKTDRAVDPLFQCATDDDAEVASLAGQALLAMGDAVRKRALDLAQQHDSPLHRAGLAYMAAMLGQPVVFVPPGAFLMGSDPAVEKYARNQEQPQHQVTLPGYWIGRYPVTNAQYAPFARARNIKFEAPNGKDDHPVVNVSWSDATGFCEWLSHETGIMVRLPTEAEWEVRHEVAWRPVARSERRCHLTFCCQYPTRTGAFGNEGV